MKNIKRLYNALINGESPKLVLIVFPLIILLLFLTPIFLTLKSPFGLNFSDTGQIGDTIGGIVGPFIAVIATLLTFFAFWVQYKSNKAQTTQFENQATKESVDRFETVFFELLKLHRDNVSDIILNEYVSGRNAFPQFYYEYRFHYFALKALHFEVPVVESELSKLTDEQCMDVSYIVFFMGMEAGSFGINESLFSNYEEALIREYFKSIYRHSEDLKTKGETTVRKYDESGVTITLKGPIVPFHGRFSTLSHYYRHLFKIVEYVDDVSSDLPIDKFKYMDILRSQLSSHEQLMLYVYSMSGFGKQWRSKSYLSTYCLLKNMPLSLVMFGPNPRDYFGEYNKNGVRNFDWFEE